MEITHRVDIPSCEGLAVDYLVSWAYKVWGSAITTAIDVVGYVVMNNDEPSNYFSFECSKYTLTSRSKQCSACSKLCEQVQNKYRHAKSNEYVTK